MAGHMVRAQEEREILRKLSMGQREGEGGETSMQAKDTISRQHASGSHISGNQRLGGLGQYREGWKALVEASVGL